MALPYRRDLSGDVIVRSGFRPGDAACQCAYCGSETIGIARLTRPRYRAWPVQSGFGMVLATTAPIKVTLAITMKTVR
jgi:hypothetical protein